MRIYTYVWIYARINVCVQGVEVLTRVLYFCLNILLKFHLLFTYTSINIYVAVFVSRAVGEYTYMYI